MKKLLVIILLAFMPALSIAADKPNIDVKSIEKSFDNGELAKFGKNIQDKSNQQMNNLFGTSSRTFDQAWEDFKKDPIGQLKYYFNEGVELGKNFIQWMKDLIDKMKK
jgi:hypothetical protein